MAGTRSLPTTPVHTSTPTNINQTTLSSTRVAQEIASSPTEVNVCSLYLEELKNEFDLQIIDICPGCEMVVARHRRQPTQLDSKLTHPNFASSSSTRSINVAKAFRDLKSSHVLPVWRSSAVCHVFIAELEYCLENSEVPKHEWFRVFAFISDDFMVVDWINRNIIKPKLNFKEACDVFRSHFESAAAADLLAREYLSCQQKLNESVQSYADRFTNICARRGIEDKDALAIEHFVEHLHSSTQRQYRTQVGLATANGHAPKVSTLTQVISYAIALEVATKGVDVGSTYHRQGSSSSTSHGKKCSFHPGSTSHTTAECRFRPKSSETRSTSFTPHAKKPNYVRPFVTAGSSFRTSSSSPTVSVTCFKCKQTGHYANKCPKPSGFSANTGSPATAYSSTWKSAPPVLSPPKFNADALRRTGRPTQQPDRYTPSNYNNSSHRQPSVRSIGLTHEASQPSTSASSENCTCSKPGSSDITEDGPQASSVSLSHVHVETKVNSLRSEPAPLMITTLMPEMFSYPSAVLFKYQDHVYRTLVDTGADVSFVDTSLIEKFNLDIKSIPGKIYLAQNGTTSDRLGQTQPLSITAMLVSEHNDLPSMEFTHKFEVMNLRREYAFIIGIDLLEVLFPHQMPVEFYNKSSRSYVYVPEMNMNKSVNSLATNIIDEIAWSPSEADTTLVIPEMEGIGAIAPVEQPERTTLSTASDVENTYTARRYIIEKDPAIIQALRINESLTGFCSLPESVVHLVVDPDQENRLFRRQYAIPESVMSAVTEIVDRWFAAGKICLAPTGCKYNSSLTVAPKKDSTGKTTGVRICLDTRAINKALLVNDKFQIPNIRSALEQLAGNSIFGEFDLAEAYLQFELGESSRPLTAFTWNGRQYMFIGCPFGLSLLPSHFQRVMSFLFSDLSFTFPYLDNLPYGSSNWSDHRDHALIIINRLNEYNLQIKPSSVKFGFSELRCLGHVISSKGVSINPDKLIFLKNVPLPRTGPELQSFLGFATFLRQHVRHFADITGPLEAVKNNKEIIWTVTMKQCFELTKEALLRAPILQFPDYSRRFVIATDASNTGVGAVLFQPSDDKNVITPDNIVAIISQKLRDSQRNYSAYKKELLAVVIALRKFHHFIWGRKDLIVITDHKPLTYMLSSENLSPALQQWIDVILDHRFIVVHRPGILNVLPDQLSRLYTSMYSATWGVPSTNIMATDADGNLSINCNAVVTRSKTSPALGGNPLDLQNVLATELEKRGMKAPPECDRQEIIQREHVSGHFGREAIFKKLWSKHIWWPKLRDEIQTVISNCDACNRFTVTKSGYNPASFITSDGPWDHIQIDCSVHLPPSPEGYTALLVIIDVFTGFIILRAMKTTSAEIVARKLWKVFSMFGIPKILQSDNGPEFTNEILRSLVKLIGIEHRFISPYNPRADGKVERAIGTVTSIIKKLLHGSVNNWPLFVPFAQLTFNQKISSLTGSTPFSLMFGRKFNEPNNLDAEQDEMKLISLDDWKQHQEKLLSVIYPAISEKIKLVKSKMIKSIDKHRRLLKENSIPSGAIVMLIDPLRQDKFEPKYVGPYTVARRARNGAYVLKDATGDILDRHVPPDQLKLISRTARRSKNDKEIYVIESILDHRGTPGKYEYFIKWKNYDSSQNSWEPATSFLDDSIIRKYWKTNPHLT